MVSNNPGLDRLRGRCAEVWDTLSGMTLSQIVEQNFKLSPETEGDPGSYDLENNPYWRKVIDSCYHPEVRRVVILKSTQVGGTILTQGIMLGFAVIDPAPAMYVTPTRDEFRIQRDRLFANALASDTPFSRLVPKKNRWNMEVLQLGAQKVNVAFAGSAQRLRGKPCKRVFKNETDVYLFKGDAGNPHKASDERVKQFQYDYLIVDESTPVGDESHIFNEYIKSNKERFHVQCPHCQHWQELRFFVLQSGPYSGCGGVSGHRTPPTTVNGRENQGGLLEPAEARKKAYYICEKGCHIEPQFKNSMIRCGMWVPKGMRIGKLKRPVDLTKIAVEKRYDYSPCGNFKLTGEPLLSRERSGFHVWTMMQSKITIGDLAAAYIDHYNDGKLRDFYQNWLGWRFRIGQKVPAWPDIARKYTRSYPSGTVPDKVWFLTAAVDVQEDLIYWMVMGWGPMRTPYLIGFGEVFQSTTQGDEDEEGIVLASDLRSIPELILTPRWPVNGTNPRGKRMLPVRKCGVDSNFRTMEVHDLVRFVSNEDRFCCIRGDDSVGPQNIRRSVISANSRSGLEYEGGLVQYQLNRTYYQDQLAARLLAAPNQDGALHLPSDILPSGKKLLRQLANVKKNDKGFYQMIDGTLGKDYRDLCGYNEAMADLVVGELGWTEKAWRDDLRDQIRKAKSAMEAKHRNSELDRE